MNKKGKHALTLVVVSLLGFYLLSFSASADPGVLYAAPTAQGSDDCSDWDNACTLQTALAGATSGDEIWVQAGVHYPGSMITDTFTLQSGVALYGGFAGTETTRDERDWETHATVLSGDIDQNDLTDPNGVITNTAHITGTNAYHVVTSVGVTETAVLDGFVVTAGQANGGALDNMGGGIHNLSGSPVLANLTLRGNSAGGGGGIYNLSGSPVLANLTFSGNSAGMGGGIYDEQSNSELSNITFSGNFAGDSGGGMFNRQSNPRLINVTFSGNSAWLGGGLRNFESNPILINVTFSGNHVETGGGGMFNSHYSNPTLMYVTFNGNIAVGEGGGLNNCIRSNPTLINVTFNGNSAGTGGGMANLYDSYPTLTNVTFSSNSASNHGGGMENYRSNLTLTNVILWGNTAPSSAGIYNSSSVPQISTSDIQGCGGSGSWDGACGTDGGGNIEADPLFVDAANGDLHLQDTSPAINAGNNAALPPDVLTDLDGNPRFVRVFVDIGAYENQTFPCPVGGVLYVDPDATGAQTGESWADALVTLQDALQVSEACEIWVKEGVYTPDQGGSHTDDDRTATFALRSGVALYGGFAGTETGRDERNWQTHLTVLSGDIDQNDLTDPNGVVTSTAHITGTNAYHVVTSVGVTETAVLDGFIITAGQANGDEWLDSHGGGIYSYEGNPTLTNITFTGNTAVGGGGMYIEQSNPTLTNITFGGNLARGGGGIDSYESSPILTNVTFSGNTAIEIGSGMANWSNSNPTLTNVILWGNTAPNGDGIFNGGSTPQISTSDIQGCGGSGSWNSACGTDGGGNIEADPLFVDAANGNLRLQNASPAINAGNNAALPPGLLTDLDGAPRFVGVFVDLGAYENQTFLCPTGGVLYVDQDATGDQTGASWEDALLTLQDALQVTEACEIWVAEGVYTPDEGGSQAGDDRSATFALKNDVALYGGFAGTETAREQRDWLTNATIFSGDIDQNDINLDGNSTNESWEDIQGNNSYHVITVNFTGNSSDAAIVLDGFTITAGQANGTNPRHVGGGLSVNSGVTNGYANLTITGNFARYGAGLYAGLSFVPSTFTHITFSGNYGMQDAGGAYITGSAPLVLEDVLFENNSTGGSGGGLFVDLANSPVLNHVSFSHNTAARWGGGMHGNYQNNSTLTYVRFEGNNAGWGGGGLYSYHSSPRLTNVTFLENSSDLGGAVFNHPSSSPEFVNVAFYGNSATSAGGAIYNNTNLGIPVFINSILWGNTSPQVSNNNSTPVYSYSDIQGSGGSGDAWDAALGTDGSGNIDADPLFVDAVNGNLRLLLASPAIDAGDNAALRPGILTDLDGAPRLVDIPTVPDTGSGTPPLVDMGAYEAQFVDVALDKGALPTSAAPGEALTFTLALTNAGSIPATGIVVTDTSPAWLWGVSFTSTLSLTNTGTLPSFVWLVQDLASGQGGVITLSGVLTVPLVAGTYTNTAFISAASDLLAENNSATITFSVPNVAPGFTSAPNIAAMQDAPYTTTAAAQDDNGDALTLTAMTLPAWLTLTDHGNGTSTLSGTPTNAEVGAHPVVLRVTDTGGLFTEQAFTITVANVNDAPAFNSAPVGRATQDAPYNYAIAAGDPDLIHGDLLMLTAPTLPAWLTLTDHGAGTATLSGTPADADVGQHTVVLRVTDSAGLFAEQAFSITVTNVNDAPAFTSAPIESATQNVPYRYAIAAGDPDLIHGDALTVTAPTLPAWLTLTDHGNGAATLSGTPGNSDAGAHTVVLRVTDNSGLTATQTFTITVWSRVYLPLVLRSTP